MIDGYKIIAFTPAGRKRYMDILAAYMRREHDAGHIDEWIVFNNAYQVEDSTYADQLAANFPWVTVLREGALTGHDTAGGKFVWRRPDHIADFFKHAPMKQTGKVIYVRLDDDIVYIDPECIPRLVKYRIANPNPFLVFPVIINNVRTSYHMQEQGVVASDWGIRNEMCDEIAWKHPDYIFQLHMKALEAIENDNLVDTFRLNSEQYTDPEYEAGHISINSFAIFGDDMAKCNVAADEEGYLSQWRPREFRRQNARCGDAMLIHFAYHTQTEYMDKTGVLNDYAKLAPPLGFRTVRLSPPKGPRVEGTRQDNLRSMLGPGQRNRIGQMRRPMQRPIIRSPRGPGVPGVRA
jgi:hypothetical protein